MEIHTKRRFMAEKAQALSSEVSTSANAHQQASEDVGK